MGIVIIPFNYEELPESERGEVIPICIESVDSHGEGSLPCGLRRASRQSVDQLVGLARIPWEMDGWLQNSPRFPISGQALGQARVLMPADRRWRRVWRSRTLGRREI